jgi:hypothetical protein
MRTKNFEWKARDYKYAEQPESAYRIFMNDIEEADNGIANAIWA